MKQNVGKTDKMIRITVGIILILALPGWFKIIGVLLLATGIIGWCGLYQILGKSTCEVKK